MLPLKCVDKSCIGNYRVIFILPNFWKLFGIVIYNRISPTVCNFIVPTQHSFTSRRSTETTLTLITQLPEILDSGGQVVEIYRDFSKALDWVLFNKLGQFDFSWNLTQFSELYRQNSQQFILYNKFNYRRYIAISRVPHEFSLIPLLFMLFIKNWYHSIIPYWNYYDHTQGVYKWNTTILPVDRTSKNTVSFYINWHCHENASLVSRISVIQGIELKKEQGCKVLNLKKSKDALRSVSIGYDT